jgi:hypothetical protein
MLLYLRLHPAICVFSYYHICVFILLPRRAGISIVILLCICSRFTRFTIEARCRRCQSRRASSIMIGVSSYYYVCVRILLYTCCRFTTQARCRRWHKHWHTTMYVLSFCYSGALPSLSITSRVLNNALEALSDTVCVCVCVHACMRVSVSVSVSVSIRAAFLLSHPAPAARHQCLVRWKGCGLDERMAH